MVKLKAQPYFQPSKSDFTIMHSNDYVWRMKEFHIHDFYEIYLSLTGDSNIFVNDKIYNMSKGDLFIFNSSDLHKILVPPKMNYERYVIEFVPAFIENFSTKHSDLLEFYNDRPPKFTHQMHLDEKHLELFITYFEQAIYYYNNPSYGSDVHIKIALAELLLMINELYRTTNTISNYVSNKDYHKIKPIINYINQNLTGDLTLQNLSSQFFISKQQLCFVFKKVTGFSVNEFIIHKRIMQAKELLKENFSVSQVGEMVGYYNLSHFIRTFKKMVGVSPKRYSKKYD